MDKAPKIQKLELESGRGIRNPQPLQIKPKLSVLQTVARGQGRFDPTNESNVYRGLIEQMMRQSKAIAAARMINSGSPSRPSHRAWSIDAQGKKYLPGSTRGGTEEFLKPAINESFSTYLQRNPKV